MHRSLTVASVLLLAGACTEPPHRGSARLVAAAAVTASGVDHVTVTVQRGASLVASHRLTSSGGVWQWTLNNLAVGPYTFAAAAYPSSDDSGATYSGSADATVTADATVVVEIVMHATGPERSVAGPVIDSITASTPTPQTGKSVSLAATATGTGTLTYAWSAGAGSFGNGSTATGQQVAWTAPSETGVVTFVLTVTDGNGNQASMTFTLEVVSATGSATVEVFMPPQITSISGQQDASNQSLFALAVQATPPSPGLALGYSWTSAGCPGESGFSNAAVANPSFTLGGAGSCTLTVTVSALYGALAADSEPWAAASITIGDSAVAVTYAPAIVLSGQSLTAAQGGQAVSLDVSAQDANTPALNLSYAWSASDGTLGEPTSTSGSSGISAVTWTAPPCLQAAGSVITVTVSNGVLGTAQSFTVLPAGADSTCSTTTNYGPPQTVVLTATDSKTISSASQNNWNDDNLRAYYINADQGSVDGFVKFDLSSIPHGSQVTGLTLHTFITTSWGPPAVNVYRAASNAWSRGAQDPYPGLAEALMPAPLTNFPNGAFDWPLDPSNTPWGAVLQSGVLSLSTHNTLTIYSTIYQYGAGDPNGPTLTVTFTPPL